MLILSNANAVLAKKGKLCVKFIRRRGRRRRRRRRPILAPRAAPPLAAGSQKWTFLGAPLTFTFNCYLLLFLVKQQQLTNIISHCLYALIAQVVAMFFCTPKVPRSIPVVSKKFFCNFFFASKGSRVRI